MASNLSITSYFSCFVLIVCKIVNISTWKQSVYRIEHVVAVYFANISHFFNIFLYMIVKPDETMAMGVQR